MDKNTVQEEKDFRYIVRIVNADLDGRKAIIDSLRKIKGVSFSLANAACQAAKIDKHEKAGNLKEEEIKRLDETIKNIQKYVPAWLLNRRKDFEIGSDRHVLSGELDFAKESDIRRLKKIKAYRGIRHMMGLPVRGQRTRSNFRKNKGKVMGVQRKRVKPKESTEKEGKKSKK